MMNPVADLLRREIAAHGPISFARFMEQALYCPDLGYYERAAETVGRRGDFYTSVSVGSLFGELLAWQFAEWLAELPRENPCPPGAAAAATSNRGHPRPHQPQGDRAVSETRASHQVGAVSNAECIVSTQGGDKVIAPHPGDAGSKPLRPEPLQLLEAGAHDGQLAKDILTWLSHHRPELWSRLEYWLLEPSARARARQRATLAGFEAKVRWFDAWEAVPAAGVTGVIFANELLDALPVHRLGWDATAKEWFEWGVNATSAGFTWVRLPNSRSRADDLLRLAGFHPFLAADDHALESVLPDGFTLEVCPAATVWWSRAAAALREGTLLTFDYGWETAEFLRPDHAKGTLRAHRKHQRSAEVLANAGGQDLTAHVHFDALRAAGEAAGLKTRLFTSQARFLTTVAETLWSRPGSSPEWTSKQRRQFQTLTHPDHLGRAFRVLAQSR